MRWGAAACLALTAAYAGCSEPPAPVSSASWFTEIPIVEGVSARGSPWPDGTFDLNEIMGSGVAFLDHDGDGDLDILHVCFPPPSAPEQPAPNCLFRQEDDGSFTDVSRASGLADPGYGQGLAVGDADNDGDPDVYFTNYGPDAFYRNDGDGTFTEATAEAGFSGDRWSSAATFCDTDRDGDLDLFVVHYVIFEKTAACVHPTQDVEDYCGPQNFTGIADILYENDGHGRFRDVTADAGLVLPDGGARAKGLGVVCADLSGDGWPDLYVANDGEPNQMWINRGDGTFVDEGIMRGAAVNRSGSPEASMGVTLGDVDGDGRADLFMTHLYGEHNTLYLNQDDLLYSDRSAAFNLSAHDLATTGFGCGFFDADNDGDLDLAVANGRVYRERVLPGAASGPFWNQFAEPNFFFENDGAGSFVEATAKGGRLTDRVEVSRGMAFGDVDNDGDVDIVLSNLDNTVRLYRNDAPKDGHHWLRVRARVGGRDAIGARLRLVDGERQLVRHVLPAASYLSSSDPRVHFGLGRDFRPTSIEVDWPDGVRERFEIEGLDRELTLIEGRGTRL